MRDLKWRSLSSSADEERSWADNIADDIIRFGPNIIEVGIESRKGSASSQRRISLFLADNYAERWANKTLQSFCEITAITSYVLRRKFIYSST